MWSVTELRRQQAPQHLADLVEELQVRVDCRHRSSAMARSVVTVRQLRMVPTVPF